MVLVPTLKVLVPTRLIPVNGEVKVVAPLMVYLRVANPQLSLLRGLGIDMLVEHLELFLIESIILPGQERVGGIVSRTWMIKVHEADPAELLAVQVTNEVPLFNTALFNVLPLPVVEPDMVYDKVGTPHKAEATALSRLLLLR